MALKHLSFLADPWILLLWSPKPASSGTKPSQGLLQVNMDKVALIWAPTTLCGPWHSTGGLRQNFLKACQGLWIPSVPSGQTILLVDYVSSFMLFQTLQLRNLQNDNQHLRAQRGWGMSTMAGEAAVSASYSSTPLQQTRVWAPGKVHDDLQSQQNLLLLQVHLWGNQPGRGFLFPLVSPFCWEMFSWQEILRNILI